MINFFRKIRRQLANENKFQRYMRYAIGEVLLIMLGIFMALQLQNWNEKRKERSQFNATVSQLHHSILEDINYNKAVSNYKVLQLNAIDTILTNSSRFTPEEIMVYLFTLSWDINYFYNSDSKFHAENLGYHFGDSVQNEIAKIAIRYVNTIITKTQFSTDRISNLLLENEISFPKFDADKPIISFDTSDTTYYSKTEINNLYNLMKTNKFTTLLKSIRTEIKIVQDDLNDRTSFARFVNGILEDYDPTLKIIYKDVGVLGTSLNGWDTSTPLAQTRTDKDVWEAIVYLKEGVVKFRCQDSWDINWGGVLFPKTTTLFLNPLRGNMNLLNRMINFFKNIRRQLANENKFQKYFRYAFGEILLVVIGILIALQINNWNENRKQEIEFKFSLRQFHEQLNIDLYEMAIPIKRKWWIVYYTIPNFSMIRNFPLLFNLWIIKKLKD